MRLFLSSENLGKYPEVFKQMVGQHKLAIIENAKDDWSEKDRTAKVGEHLDQLAKQGFEAEEIDLRKYFGKPAHLEEKMAEYGGLFVFGGNTFILRRAMAASGLDKILQNLLPANKLAYGGSSAGSCVMAKNLHGIDIGDFPDIVPENYPDKNIPWDGIGIIDFMIVPHYDSDWWGKEAKAAVDYLKIHKLAYKILKDDQVYIIDGKREELLK